MPRFSSDGPAPGNSECRRRSERRHRAARRCHVFRQQVAPIFEQHCVACHQGEKPKGGLNLADRKRAIAGGESGPVIVPGKPDESLLIEYISGDTPEMPKGKPPLSPDQVAAIERLDRRRRPVARGARAARQAADRRRVVVAGAAGQSRRCRRLTTRGFARRSMRSFCAKLRDEQTDALGRGRPPHADPPPDLRPARPAADARGDRRVRARRAQPTPTSSWSTGCSPRPATASAGAGTGSTSCTTARRTATTRTSRGPTPGPIATT